ncbi:MAG: hypothetical protein LUG96_10095 [Tannerellaceae bacterium]|nr:hypothetical protein [Tannerellaceae bacterium]
MITTTKDETFFSEYVTRLRMRDFRITVTYRFGTLKDSIKKVRRGISNDDMKGNDDGNMGGGPS